MCKGLGPPASKAASPKGNRPRLNERAAFDGTSFFLHIGIPWNELPEVPDWRIGMTQATAGPATAAWRMGVEPHRPLNRLRERDQRDGYRVGVDSTGVPRPGEDSREVRTPQASDLALPMSQTDKIVSRHQCRTRRAIPIVVAWVSKE